TPSHSVAFGHAAETIDPTIGITGLGSPTTAPIPAPGQNVSVDPDQGGPAPAVLQPVTSFNRLPAAERVITIYNGTISTLSYVSGHEGDPTATDASTQLVITFTSSNSTGVIAWCVNSARM